MEFSTSEPNVRFGMIRPNLHLKICLSIIYYMGTWPPRGKYRRFYMIYTGFSFLFMLGIFLATEIINLIMNFGDMEKMIAGATLLMTNCTHASKVLVILFRQRRIQALIDTTRGKLFSRANYTYGTILRKYTWQGIFHHIAYQSFGAIAVFCWGITPIADLVAGRSRQLPMEGWYPYNVTQTPAFEITSTHQGVAIIVACFHNVAMDTLVTGLITVACCQLTLLNKTLSSIDDKANLRNKSESGQALENEKGDFIRCEELMLQKNSKSYEDLKLCVMHSNMIYNFCKEIQDIFGVVIFLQFFVNCIIICLIAFNITQMKVYIPSVLIGMVMYMCCMTYQIFIYCWHGNELHLHSKDIVLAVYSCKWWHASNSFKRGMQIIMTRAQRPLVMSAGNIMLLSLQTFVRILRMSYSIFTVLESSTGI